MANNKYTKQSFPQQHPPKADPNNLDNILPSPSDLEKKADKAMKDFSALLDQFSSLEEKKKSLWKNIYENAITDRNNAYMLFADLYRHVCDNESQHSIHGQTLAKYIEKMTKANDQIVKLAEMIDEQAEAEGEEITDPSKLYDQIQNSSKN